VKECHLIGKLLSITHALALFCVTLGNSPPASAVHSDFCVQENLILYRAQTNKYIELRPCHTVSLIKHEMDKSSCMHAVLSKLAPLVPLLALSRRLGHACPSTVHGQGSAVYQPSRFPRPMPKRHRNTTAQSCASLLSVQPNQLQHPIIPPLAPSLDIDLLHTPILLNIRVLQAIAFLILVLLQIRP